MSQNVPFLRLNLWDICRNRWKTSRLAYEASGIDVAARGKSTSLYIWVQEVKVLDLFFWEFLEFLIKKIFRGTPLLGPQGEGFERVFGNSWNF